MADSWRARTLADTALLAFVTERAGAPDGDRWTAAQLAAAAQARHPEVAEASVMVDVARAGEITAGARPQPGFIGEIGRATDPGPFESPWFGAVTLSVTLELGGKRGARIAAARARTARATVDAAAAEWTVALRAHEALVSLAGADSLLAVVDDERSQLGAVLASARRRVETGELSSGELARLASEQATLEVERARAAADRDAAVQALARALAMPAAQLHPLVPMPDRVDGCRGTSRMDAGAMESRALTRRAEVGQTLADYAASEAALRLEVARTWPDLELGPGFIWDGGVHRWNLLTVLPSLMLNRNRGPIAEATARRVAAGVRVDAAQQAVLADVGAAREACAGALRQLVVADSAVGALSREAAVVAAAVARGERGERDRLAMALVQARARRERLGAELSVWQAGLVLERAVGGWLAAPALQMAPETERIP
jgi:outer membrane protein TolC